MRASGRGFICLSLALIALWVVISALKWPLRAALFPVVIGIPVFIMAMIEVYLDMFIKKESDEARGADFQLSEDMDPALANRRTIVIFVWLLGYFFLILFVGLSAAIPIYFILYFKLAGREKWGITLILSALAWACFYGLFIRLLRTPFTPGWVQMGLRSLGIL